MQGVSPEQVNYIIQNTEDAVCVLSSSGILLYTNTAAEKLFGISADQKTRFWDAVPFIQENDSFIQLIIDAVVNKMKAQEAIVEYYNDGSAHNVHVKIMCYKGDAVQFLMVISDLTQLLKVNSAFTRYTSPEIAEYVLTSPNGERVGGTTRNVTILMSDLRGFTALSTRLSPDILIITLNHYFEKMSAIIKKNEGTILEFLGDGIFVVFGAPKEQSDHASRAVKCAIEMENAMSEINNWNRQNGYPELEMGIGINSGNAVVGNIGSADKMKYGCIGSTVNMTGRVEGLTVGGQIFITENTKNLISEEIKFLSESSILLKGAASLTKIYEVKSIGNTILCTHPLTDITWAERLAPEKYSFFILEEKMVSGKEYTGTITRISENRKYAIFSTDISLKEKNNLMLKIKDEDAYAKVIHPTEDGYLICFTSINKDLL